MLSKSKLPLSPVPTPLLDDEIMLGIGFKALDLRGSHLTGPRRMVPGEGLTSTVVFVRGKSVVFLFFCADFLKKILGGFRGNHSG